MFFILAKETIIKELENDINDISRVNLCNAEIVKALELIRNIEVGQDDFSLLGISCFTFKPTCIVVDLYNRYIKLEMKERNA